MLLNVELKFDLEGYNKLFEMHKRNKKTTSKDNWFTVSEVVFKKQALTTKEDFIKLIAFAYSWMPTIPKLLGAIDWNVVHPLIKLLQQGDMTVRYELLSIIVPYINNSVVGTSKVLHFVAPNHVPIIDSRVINTWSILFKSNKLKKYPQGLNDEIVRYLQYWDCLNAWVSNINGVATIRDIEGMLYGIDGNIS